jgi:hypothetical protein
VPTALSEIGCAGRGQYNFLSLEGGWITSWQAPFKSRKETGILPHYYFPWRTWNVTPRKKRQANTILVEHFNSIPFHKSEPANKQHTHQSINQSEIAFASVYVRHPYSNTGVMQLYGIYNFVLWPTILSFTINYRL